MTQLVINVQQHSDLEKLLELLRSLKLSFTQSETKSIAAQNATDKKEVLSIESIKKLYPNEWVLVALTGKNDDNKGIVIFHHPDKREMALQGRDLIKNHSYTTHFYTGEFPKMRHIGLMRKIKQ